MNNMNETITQFVSDVPILSISAETAQVANRAVDLGEQIVHSIEDIPTAPKTPLDYAALEAEQSDQDAWNQYAHPELKGDTASRPYSPEATVEGLQHTLKVSYPRPSADVMRDHEDAITTSAVSEMEDALDLQARIYDRKLYAQKVADVTDMIARSKAIQATADEAHAAIKAGLPRPLPHAEFLAQLEQEKPEQVEPIVNNVTDIIEYRRLKAQKLQAARINRL